MLSNKRVESNRLHDASCEMQESNTDDKAHAISLTSQLCVRPTGLGMSYLYNLSCAVAVMAVGSL